VIRVKRAYDPPAPEDGARYLVDRLWPRGLTKEKARLDGWLKDLAPSEALRREFHRGHDRWSEFRRLYRLELGASEKQALLARLTEESRQGTVSLIFAARDQERNNALVLKEFLEERLAGP